MFKPRCTAFWLFATVVEIPNHQQHAARVWSAFSRNFSHSSLRQFYFAYSRNRWMPISIYLILVSMFFGIDIWVEKNYSHPSVLAISQWTKKVGAKNIVWKLLCGLEKTTDGLFLSLVRPDFNVLPLIQPHFSSVVIKINVGSFMTNNANMDCIMTYTRFMRCL